MSRAVIALAAAVALLVVPRSGARAEIESGPDVVDGAGMIDYNGRPNFKVGQWVKYRTTSKSLKGVSDDYTVTIQIAGEQVFWDEPCFWVESWISRPGGGERSTASLVSYAAFQDTMAFWNIEWFMRMIIDSQDEHGRPNVRVTARDASELRLRKANWDADFKDRARVDTVGPINVTIGLGTFPATKVVRRTGMANSQDHGDSTYYYRRNGFETYYVSREVPITSTWRIDIEDIQQAKAWKAGQFNEDSLNILERGLGATTLIAYGDAGLTPKLVPAKVRGATIDRKLIDEFVNLPAEQATRVVGPGTPEPFTRRR